MYLFTSLVPRAESLGTRLPIYKLEAEYDKGRTAHCYWFLPSVFILQLPIFDSCLIDDTTVIV